MNMELNEVANSNELVKSLVLELVKININYKHSDLENKIKNNDTDILSKIKNVNQKLYEMVQIHIVGSVIGGRK